MASGMRVIMKSFKVSTGGCLPNEIMRVFWVAYSADSLSCESLPSPLAELSDRIAIRSWQCVEEDLVLLDHLRARDLSYHEAIHAHNATLEVVDRVSHLHTSRVTPPFPLRTL